MGRPWNTGSDQRQPLFRPRFHHYWCVRAETTGHPIACLAALLLEAATDLGQFRDNTCTLFFLL